MHKIPSQNNLIGWLAIGAGLATAMVFLTWWSTSAPLLVDHQKPGVVITSTRNAAFGNLGNQPTLRAAAATKVADQAVVGSSAPAPEGVQQYVFDYAGTLPAVDLPVLRRSTDLGAAALNATTRSAFTNLVDMHQFSKLPVQQILLGSSDGTGMTLTLDYASGTINMYANSPSVLDKMALSNTDESPSKHVLPPDETLIALANAFLDKYQVSREGLGDPVINKFWITQGAGVADQESALIPNDVSVVYPWKIHGHPVYDESGTAYGLYVGVNLSTRQVNGFSNLVPMHFTASHYDLVSDPDTILRVVHAGGVYNLSSQNEGAETVHVQTSAPEVAYIISRYQLEQNQVEYLVPALRFAVQAPDLQFYPKYIMVPLVKQILDAAQGVGTVDTHPLPSPALPD